jgi:hypothetical protein
MEGAMNGRLIVRALSMLLFVLALAGLGYGRPAVAQTAQPAASPAVAHVRQIVTNARKEIESYTTAGGAAGAADHPAIKWHAALWEVRERSPQSEAGAMAAAEAIRLLSRAGLWDRAHARVESLGFDDAAWERVPAVIYEEGVARKDLAYTVEKLSQAAASTTSAPIRAAALLALGRAQRRLGDNTAATRTLEAAPTIVRPLIRCESACFIACRLSPISCAGQNSLTFVPLLLLLRTGPHRVRRCLQRSR